MRHLKLWMPVAAVCALAGAAGAQVNVTWNVAYASGNWNDGSRWAGLVAPGANDTAVLSDVAVDVTITAAHTIDTVNIGTTGANAKTFKLLDGGAGTSLTLTDGSDADALSGINVGALGGTRPTKVQITCELKGAGALNVYRLYAGTSQLTLERANTNWTGNINFQSEGYGWTMRDSGGECIVSWLVPSAASAAGAGAISIGAGGALAPSHVDALASNASVTVNSGGIIIANLAAGAILNKNITLTDGAAFSGGYNQEQQFTGVLSISGTVAYHHYYKDGHMKWTLASTINDGASPGRLVISGVKHGGMLMTTGACNWSGGTEITRASALGTKADGGLGSGAVEVNGGRAVGNLRPGDAAGEVDDGLTLLADQTTPPTINVNANGRACFGYDAIINNRTYNVPLNLKGGILVGANTGEKCGAGAITAAGNITLSDGTTSEILTGKTASDTLTITGNISDGPASTGRLAKVAHLYTGYTDWGTIGLALEPTAETYAGFSRLVLNPAAANTFGGGLDVLAGEVEAKKAGALGDGPVRVAAGGALITSADGALDSPGSVTIAAGGRLELNSAETKALTIGAGGYLGGTVTPDYSKVTVTVGAILDSALPATPSLGQMAAGAGHGVYLGKSGADATNYTTLYGSRFGAGGSTIYRGLGAGAGKVLTFTGTAESTGELAFHAQPAGMVKFSGCTLNVGNPATDAVTLSGGGVFKLVGAGGGPVPGNYARIVRTGDSGDTVLATSGVLNGKALDVSNSRVLLAVVGAQSLGDGGDPATATLNLNGRGVLLIDDGTGHGSGGEWPADATVNVKSGGAIVLAAGSKVDASGHIDADRADLTIDWQAGSYLGLGADIDLNTKNALPDNGNANIILSAWDFAYAGINVAEDIVLAPLDAGGNGPRMTTAPDWRGRDMVITGTGVLKCSVATAGKAIRVANQTRAEGVSFLNASNQLTYDEYYSPGRIAIYNVSLANQTLVVGAAGTFLSVNRRGDGWSEIDQAGGVQFGRAVGGKTIGKIDIQAGVAFAVKTSSDYSYYANYFGSPKEVNIAAGAALIIPGDNQKAANAWNCLFTGDGRFGFGGSNVVDLEIIPTAANTVVGVSPGNDGAGALDAHCDLFLLDYNSGQYRATLYIDVVNGRGGAPVAGVDHDQLRVLGAATIDAGRLTVDLSTAVPGSIQAAHEFTILTTTSNLSAKTFADVQWIGGTGNVLYGNGLVKLTNIVIRIPGDADLNGYVDLPDLIALARNWKVTPANWGQGDFDGDTIVDLPDLIILARNWHAGVPPPTGGAVPEPGSLVLLALGGLALARKRR